MKGVLEGHAKSLISCPPLQAEHDSFNVGVYAMESNERTLALMDLWTEQRKGAQGDARNEQFALNELAAERGWLCSGKESCSALKKAGKPALLRHPTQVGWVR